MAFLMRKLRKKSSRLVRSRRVVIPSEVEESLTISEIRKIQRCSDFARHDRLLLTASPGCGTPLINPSVHRLVPKLAVLRLKYPMAFVGEIQHLRRHLQALAVS